MKGLEKVAILVCGLMLMFATYGCNKSKENMTGVNHLDPSVTASSSQVNDNSTKNNTESEDPWKVISQNKVNIAFVQAGYFNENNGVTVGLDGEVHYTVNGGKDWPSATNKSMCRFGLDFADTNTVWHCGNADVGVSIDGGKSWTIQSGAFVENGYYISAMDSKKAWIGSRTKLSVTTDGAKTLNDMKLPKDVGSVATIFARSEKEGCVLNYDGTMFYTRDGGENWTSSKIVENGTPIKILCSECNTVTAALRFLNENDVVAAYCDDSKGIWVIRSSDGGKSWTREKATNDYANNIYMTHDGNYITFDDAQNKITLLKYEKP